MIEVNNENWYTVAEVAKILILKNSKGKNIGRNNLYNILRYNKVIMNNNMPYQSMLNLSMCYVHVMMKGDRMCTITLFNARGVNYLKNGFAVGKFFVCTETKQKKHKIKQEDIF